MFKVTYEERYSSSPVKNIWISAVFSGILLLVAASFQKYFFFAPSSTNPALGAFQTLYMVGFILLVVVPPAIFAFVPKPSRNYKSAVIVAASVLPFAAIASHVTLAISYGDPYLNYLATYPVLFLSHVIIPGAYILVSSARSAQQGS